MAFGKRKAAKVDPTAFVLRKEYKKAIELYRAQLADDDANGRLRLADTLVLDGQKKEAISEYKKVASLYAGQGFLLKAIGVNKKIVKLDPAQEEVHDQLSKLYEEKGLLAPSSAPAEAAGEPSLAAAAPVDPSGGNAEAADVPGIDELPMEISVDAIADALQEVPAGEESGLGPLGEVDLAALGDTDLGALGDTDLDLAPDEPEAAAAAPQAEEGAGFTYKKTPLFSDFKADEFVDVVKNLEQEFFPAEAVIVTEGDPGDALYVIVTGTVRVMTTARGKQLQLAVLNEGAFFGEGSLITGRPRTATVIANEESELFKLDKAGFDDVVSRYPRVREVMERFHRQRAESTVQSILKSGKK
jgi:hypothetical protein